MFMGGRFGKYGDLKRRVGLQRGRKEKARLEKAGAVGLPGGRTGIPAGYGSSYGSAVKTFKTAVVVIPPRDLWGPIQELRRQYDRRFRRWMPHITLIYPFRPVAAFQRLVPLLARACRSAQPFEIRMERFGIFNHRRRMSTIYLVPEPAKYFKTLFASLSAVVPDCNDTGRFPGGFTPHLSVGQVRSSQARDLCDRWQATWQPLSFRLTRIYLIRRSDPPNDVFQEGPAVFLGER